MKKYFLVYIIGLLFASFLVSPVKADILPSVPTQNELVDLAGKPTHRVNIPGLSYTDIKQVQESDGTYLYIPFMGEYISAIYRYLVIAAGLVAVIVIIVAGIQWTASGGNSSTIESAKKRITGALTGLGLAVGSYVILYTINPNLVNFQSLKIKYVEAEEIVVTPSDEPGNAVAPSGPQAGTSNVPYYAQYEGPWAFKKPGDPEWPVSAQYKGSNKVCATIKDRACGTTSLSMVLRFYGENVDPLTVSKWGLGCNGGFDIRGTARLLPNQWPGYKLQIIDKNSNTSKKILDLLLKNKPLVYNCSPCQGFKRDNKEAPEYEGHYVVITGIADESKDKLNGPPEGIFLTINDPGRNIDRRIMKMSLAQVLENFVVIGYLDKT